MQTLSPEALRAHLLALADPDYAAFTARLIPDLRRPLLGVRVPVLRRMAKELVRDDPRRVLDEWLRDETHEELLLRALVIGGAKWEWDELAHRIQSFVPLIDNWAVCDLACSAFVGVRAHREACWPLLMSYLASAAPYRQRFALVMMLTHYLTDDWAERVLTAVSRLHPVGQPAAMAAGWLLQKAFVSWPERVYALLLTPSLDAAIRRLARQKLLESRQTSPAWRSRVRAQPLPPQGPAAPA